MMNMLDEMTDIATKTKMNADYVPGMVTVLQGRELEAMGVSNVNEALSLVPGITISRQSTGETVVNVRGSGAIFGVAKLLYLLNGRRSDDLLFASGSSLGNYSLGIVERIEIIRGPGAAMYGGYALGAVVNVITRHANAIAVHSNTLRNRMVELSLDTGDETPVVARLNAALQTSPNSGVISGADGTGVFSNPGSFSYAPGIVNDKKRSQNLNLDVDWRGFTFHARHSKNTNYEAFGLNYLLAPSSQAGYLTHQQTDYALDHTWSWGEQQQLKIGVGEQRKAYTEYLVLWPKGTTAFGAVSQNGIISNSHYSERRTNADIEWQRKSWANHDLLLSATFNITKAYDIWTRNNFNFTTLQPINGWQNGTGANNWLKEGIKRTEKAMFGQDEWHLTEALTITTGIRFDSFNDVGSNVSPRFAAVYNMNNHHILKAQFATAFRPPSAFELYLQGVEKGNQNLKAEVSRNYDLGYVYKEGSTTIRGVLAYSTLSNFINRDVNKVMQNMNSGRRIGLELEGQTLLFKNLRVDGNVSYEKTHDNVTATELVGAVRWLANAQLAYQPMSNNTVHLWLQYMGKRARAAFDPRKAAPSNMVWNMSLQQQDFLIKGISLSFGIRNIFDRAVRYPSPAYNFGGGFIAQTYANDFPDIGRRGWLLVRYEM
ncbi:MAG: TonB-dependent receptor [Mariprofundaceae bacterium]|nr:TonB-dependent receptor [Mariprofundaceae bacterium]